MGETLAACYRCAADAVAFDRRLGPGPRSGHDGRVPAADFSNSVLLKLTTSSERDGVIDQLVQLGPG